MQMLKNNKFQTKIKTKYNGCFKDEKEAALM